MNRLFWPKQGSVDTDYWGPVALAVGTNFSKIFGIGTDMVFFNCRTNMDRDGVLSVFAELWIPNSFTFSDEPLWPTPESSWTLVTIWPSKLYLVFGENSN